MTKLDSDLLKRFGIVVERARSLKGLNQNELGLHESFVSGIEKGKRNISAKTVGKLIKELDLDKAWIEPFLKGSVIGDEERADQLLLMAKNDAIRKKSSDALLISLAYEFAQEAHDEVFTAYQSLRGALKKAAKLEERGKLPQNVDDQLQAVIQRVAAYNDAGNRDAGQAEIDEAFKQNEVAAITLCNLGFDQALVRNDSKLAAKLTLKRLKLEAQPQGLFNAVIDECNAMERNQPDEIFRFYSKVNLNLSIDNARRAKPPQKGWAAHNIAADLCTLAFQEQGIDRLGKAKAYALQAISYGKKFDNLRLQALGLQRLSECLRLIFEREGEIESSAEMEISARLAYRLIQEAHDTEPKEIATVINCLGTVLSDLGKAERDAHKLREAIIFFEDAISKFKILGEAQVAKVLASLNWLGVAHLRLGRLEQSDEDLQKAQVIFEKTAANTQKAKPFDWAISQWNLADLVFARWEISGDVKVLNYAQAHLSAANEKFSEGLSEYQLNKCAELQLKIDNARVK